MAEVTRFSVSYLRVNVRPLSAPLVMLLTVPISPPLTLWFKVEFRAVPALDVACVLGQSGGFSGVTESDTYNASLEYTFNIATRLEHD